MKFIIYRDKEGEWRWRAVAKNGKIIAVGESYTTKASCEACVKNIKENASLGVIICGEKRY